MVTLKNTAFYSFSNLCLWLKKLFSWKTLLPRTLLNEETKNYRKDHSKNKTDEKSEYGVQGLQDVVRVVAHCDKVLINGVWGLKLEHPVDDLINGDQIEARDLSNQFEGEHGVVRETQVE